MAKKPDVVVRVRFDQERIEQLVTVDEFVGAIVGNFGTLVQVLSKMVIDEKDEYVDPEEGRKRIGKIPVGELRRLTEGMAKSLRDALVNPQSASGS